MQVVNVITSRLVKFSTISDGGVFMSGKEVFIKLPNMYIERHLLNDFCRNDITKSEPVNAIHAKSGYPNFFKDDTMVEPCPGAYLNVQGA